MSPTTAFRAQVPRSGPMPINLSYRLGRDLGQSLAEIVEGDKPLALILVTLDSFTLFNRLYGDEAAGQVLEILEDLVRRLGPDTMAGARLLALDKSDPGSMVAVLENSPKVVGQLMERCLMLRAALRQQLNQQMVRLTGQSLTLNLGFAPVDVSDAERLPDLIYRALHDARQVAEGTLDAAGLDLLAEFRQLLEKPLLRAVYEPIVDITNGQVLGWESLARGPENEYFRSPQVMFDFAEEVGALFDLESTCREQAICGLGGLQSSQKLFLNIHPKTLSDPNFRSGNTLRLLAEHGLGPRDVVFEITERHSIRDFSLFNRALHHYRSQGFGVAIDDMGTGYSGLMRIARLRPDYLKVDMSLVRGIDSNPMQRALMETLVTFADKVGATLIAEGIETPTELSSLVSMGVRFGQGYYLAKPGNPKPFPQVTLGSQARAPQGSIQHSSHQSLLMRSLAQKAPMVSSSSLVRELKDLLDCDPISSCLVVDDGKVSGLVMSHSLDRLLGTRFGTSIYLDRSVKLVMDNQPLIVDANTPVQQAAEKAMNRDKFKLYDHVVVIDQDSVLGVASVQHMLDALAKVQVEMAKGANPLTGLPGNVALEQEIERRSNLEEPASFIYVDLDNFKTFNDTYGFQEGDRMIRMVADMLRWAVRRHGNGGDMVGHVGGDDYVVITTPEKSERICRAMVRCCARLLPKLYNAEHQEAGFIEAKGRDGKPGRFPLVSVSLGIVDCAGGACGLQHVGQRAADVKKWAKSKPGNVWVRDRRKACAA